MAIGARRNTSRARPPDPFGENAAIAALLDKRLAFVTGKGGVGKTTVAYALGLAAARAGKRAIVCEIAAQERGSALFDRPPIGFRETELEPGLWAISIDPELMIREYLEVQMPVRAMASVLSRSQIFNYLAAATPGLQEMVTIGKVWELALAERKAPGAAGTYDVVIVDAPATGHGVGFLRAAAGFRDLTRVGPLSRQAAQIERTLADPEATGVAIVATGEEMAVNEALGMRDELAADPPFAIDRIYANALYPQRYSATERRTLSQAIDTATPAAAAALTAACEESVRAAAQRDQLARLSTAVAAPVVELPFLSTPRLGVAELRQLAEALP